jgi:hypothetical protein
MANVYQLPAEAQPARNRWRWRTRRGRRCIGKVERATPASSFLYESIISARPVDRA